MTTYFDYLPVELLHMIFEYLSNCDIIWSFYNLSSYLNSILNNYNFYQFNFQFISKINFDYVCNCLSVEKIRYLTLSNNSQTPNQIQLFFSRFNLQNFFNLQILTLLSITNQDISIILSDLPKLKYLHSLFTESRLKQPLFIGQILNQLKILKNLSITYGDIFDHNISFPLYNLKGLDAGICNFLELRRLQMIVPSLISLKINLHANHQLQLLKNSKIWILLKRLDLTLNDEIISFNDIQEFLSHFQNLKYLTLNIRGLSNDLANGYYWEICPIIINLKKFHFIIEFYNAPIKNREQILKSFSTSFWLDIKKWFIAITTDYIYTISCFNNKLFITSILPPLSTLSNNNSWFYLKIKQIKIEKNISLINLYKFSNLEKFDLLNETILLSKINFNKFLHLRHLIFHQTISNEILNSILKQNSCINHLTFSFENNFNQLKPLKTIFYLSIQNSNKFFNYKQIKNLCRIFPLIKQISIHLNSIQTLSYLINNLFYLENGIFYLYKFNKLISEEWLKENTRLNNKIYSFTCRTELNQFSLWISYSIPPIISLKDKITETLSFVEGKSVDKCLIQ